MIKNNENLNFYKLIDRFRPNASEDKIRFIKDIISEYAVNNNLASMGTCVQRLNSRKKSLTFSLLYAFKRTLSISDEDFDEVLMMANQKRKGRKRKQ